MPSPAADGRESDGPFLIPPLRRVQVGGSWRAWREHGAGPGLPLLLLHGIGSNARLWAGQFEPFGRTRRTVAWNAPGYRGSDPLPLDWPSPADYAEAALRLLDRLAIDRCVIVGQSLGAVMAVALEAVAPDRVAALVLASPATGYATPPGGNLPPTVAARIDDIRRVGPLAMADLRAPRLLSDGASPAARALVREAMAELDPHGYSQAARMLASADLVTAVASVRTSVLTIWGSADVITPPDRCRMVAEAAPGAHMLELDGPGHAMPAEAPGLFNSAVAATLRLADAA
jgi:pimeloyl-ACP methyl ester carboxylesterase